MKTFLMALVALSVAVLIANPAAATTAKYYWYDACKDSPGNNLKCIRMKEQITWRYDNGDTQQHDFDRITVSIGEYCSAQRISDGLPVWGVQPFIVTASNGHTPTITRYYVVPAGCKYHIHMRHYWGAFGEGTAYTYDIPASYADDDLCFEYNIIGEEFTKKNCPNTWPGDSGNPSYPVPLD